MNWELNRPESRLPSSYLWTWDHSTNWVLDDPGMQAFGCNNRYTKQPETYIEDYRRLTDAAAELGIKGIIIWGFLRDSHGGVEYAKRVADYAASRGIAIMPGLGTTHYGGCYYEGDHPYCIENFVKKNPDACMINEDGTPRGGSACAAHPAFAEWIAAGTDWLYREFDIGGVNIENGDWFVDHHPLMKQRRANWPKTDTDIYFNQAVSYQLVLDAIGDRLPETLGTYATYGGFMPGKKNPERKGFEDHKMDCDRPAMFDTLPPEGICQWTISGMVRGAPLPLTAYLDDGAPAAAFDNEFWPADLVPPSKRSTGFLHQPSQWWGGYYRRLGRYQQNVSTIKEACLRAYRGGLEGVSIHGEVTAMYVPWALNYLAFSHFTHWPEDSMNEFARKTLAPVLGDEQKALDFVRLFANWESGRFPVDFEKETEARDNEYRGRVARGDRAALEPYRFWHWLHRVATENFETQTVSFF